MKRSKTHAGLDDLTIVHFNDGVAFVRCTVEGRLCNVHYSLAAYLAGDDKPNYPVPATLAVAAMSTIHNDCKVLAKHGWHIRNVRALFFP